jgi:tRNA pseudouridine55 synthase
MNSFLLIDKPAGISSFDVIRRLRKITGIRKIGHAGTLDPFATGLLICAIGQYTRLLKYAEAQSKCYEASLLLGKASSTGDPEGEISAAKIPNISEQDLLGLKDKVLALKELKIPLYSAIKIEGKRAYQYAREGEILQMPMRKVDIYDFEILDELQADTLRYRVKVSKGTYIRALSEYIASELGTIGMTTALRRTEIGEITVSKAYSLPELESDWQKAICPVQEILATLPALELSETQAQDFEHGRRFSLAHDFADGTEIALYVPDHRLLGIGSSEKGYIRPVLVMNKEHTS